MLIPELAKRVINLYKNKGLRSLLSGFKWYLTFWYERNRLSPRRRIRELRYRIRYGSSAPKPYRLIWINPEKVEHMLVPNFKSKISPKGTHIIPGDWDVDYSDEGLIFDNDTEQKYNDFTLIRIKDYVFYQSMKQHFDNEISWKNTEIYEWFCNNQEKLSSGSNYRLGKIDKRFVLLNKLYENIKKDGYATQRELLSTNDTVMHARKIPTPEYDEIMVNIGREGDIILDDGRHRFMIAKILGLEIIPVRVLVRHEIWQKKRQKVAILNSTETKFAKNERHPDLQEFRSRK